MTRIEYNILYCRTPMLIITGRHSVGAVSDSAANSLFVDYGDVTLNIELSRL